MATLSITVPDAQVPRVLAALEGRLGLPQPATADDARQFLVDTLIEIVRVHEENEAAEAARAAVTPIGAAP